MFPSTRPIACLAAAAVFALPSLAAAEDQQAQYNFQLQNEQDEQWLSEAAPADTVYAFGQPSMQPQQHSDQQVRQLVSNWPQTARQAAESMLDQYGPPDEVTQHRLIWHNNGPWKHTVVHREQVEHYFPKPHYDVLEQTIDLDVPADKFDELAEFDGSVIVDRTKGEISARCDREAANFLAINLAHDIINDRASVGDAREQYAQTIEQVMQVMESGQGQLPNYARDLQFQPPRRVTNPDQVAPRFRDDFGNTPEQWQNELE